MSVFYTVQFTTKSEFLIDEEAHFISFPCFIPKMQKQYGVDKILTPFVDNVKIWENSGIYQYLLHDC